MIRIVPWRKEFSKCDFCCTVSDLDEYFRCRVGQDIRRRVTSCFVALDGNGSVAGYYTLSAASILLDRLPEEVRRKLPRYTSIPAVEFGRLAVAWNFQHIGLGAALVYDAWRKSLASEIAAYAMIVHAKNPSVGSFYSHNGFTAFKDNPLCFYISLELCKKLLQQV